MGKQRKLRRAQERAAVTQAQDAPRVVMVSHAKESKPRRTDPYRRNVYATDEEWERVEPILREVVLTRSKFITHGSGGLLRTATVVLQGSRIVYSRNCSEWVRRIVLVGERFVWPEGVEKGSSRF